MMEAAVPSDMVSQQRMQKKGQILVLTGRNVKKLEDAKEELERLYGIKVLPVQADVSAGADNEAIVAERCKAGH